MGSTVNDLIHVGRELRHRLIHYRVAIDYGDYPDLRAAVKATELRRQEAVTKDIRRTARAWQSRQVKRMRAMGGLSSSRMSMPPAPVGVRRPFSWHDERVFQVNRSILLADSPPCSYCGASATSADHILARARGGSHDLDNLTAACHRCNCEKGTFSIEEWKVRRERKGRPWPPV